MFLRADSSCVLARFRSGHKCSQMLRECNSWDTGASGYRLYTLPAAVSEGTGSPQLIRERKKLSGRGCLTGAPRSVLPDRCFLTGRLSARGCLPRSRSPPRRAPGGRVRGQQAHQQLCRGGAEATRKRTSRPRNTWPGTKSSRCAAPKEGSTPPPTCGLRP